MSDQVAVIYRTGEIIVAINGVPYVINEDENRYQDILDELATGNPSVDYLQELVSYDAAAHRVRAEFENSGIDVDEDGDMTYLGNPVPADLSAYLDAAVERGDAAPVVAFIKRLYNNPNERTRNTLFTFMEKNKLPILNDGRFLAYKAVRADYRDKHTGTVDNSPGKKPEMPWSGVDTNPENLCSRGFHACAKEYLTGFWSEHAGDRVVTMAIAPEDVGAVPYDYDGTKLRCRAYESMQDITEQYKREQQTIKINVNEDEGLMADRERVRSGYVLGMIW